MDGPRPGFDHDVMRIDERRFRDIEKKNQILMLRDIFGTTKAFLPDQIRNELGSDS